MQEQGVDSLISVMEMLIDTQALLELGECDAEEDDADECAAQIVAMALHAGLVVMQDIVIISQYVEMTIGAPNVTLTLEDDNSAILEFSEVVVAADGQRPQLQDLALELTTCPFVDGVDLDDCARSNMSFNATMLSLNNGRSYRIDLGLQEPTSGREELYLAVLFPSLFSARGGLVPATNLSTLLHDFEEPSFNAYWAHSVWPEAEQNQLCLAFTELVAGIDEELGPLTFSATATSADGQQENLDLSFASGLEYCGSVARRRLSEEEDDGEGSVALMVELMQDSALLGVELSVSVAALPGAVHDSNGNIMSSSPYSVEGALFFGSDDSNGTAAGPVAEDSSYTHAALIVVPPLFGGLALLLCLIVLLYVWKKRRLRRRREAKEEALEALEMQKQSLVMVKQMAHQAGWLSNENHEEVSLFKQAIVKQQSKSRRLSESARAGESAASQFGVPMNLPAMLPPELDGALTAEFKQRHDGREPTEQEKVTLLKVMLEEPSTASAWGAQLTAGENGVGLTMAAPTTLAPAAWVPTVPSELLLAAQTFCEVREEQVQSDELLALLKMRNAIDAAFVVPLRAEGAGGGVRLHPPKLHPPGAFGADGPPPQPMPLMVANFEGLGGVPPEIRTLLKTAGPGGVSAMAKSLIEGAGEPRASELQARFGAIGAVADGSSDEQLRLLRTLLEVNIESAVELSKGGLTLSHAVTLDDNGRALDPWAVVATLTPSNAAALPAPVVAAALAGFEAQHGRPATSELEAVTLMRDTLQSYVADGAAPRLAMSAASEGAQGGPSAFGAAATLDHSVLRAAAVFETAAPAVGKEQAKEAEKIQALKQCLDNFCDGTQVRMHDATEATSPISPQQAAPMFGAAQMQAPSPMPSPVHLALQVEFARHTAGAGTSASHDVMEMQDLGKQFVADFEARSAAAAQLQQAEAQNPGASSQNLTFNRAQSITMPKRQQTRPLELSTAAAAFQSSVESPADATTEAIHHRKSSVSHGSQNDRNSGRFDLQEMTRDTQADRRRADPRKRFQQMEQGKGGRTFNLKSAVLSPRTLQTVAKEQHLIRSISSGKHFEVFGVGSRVSHPKRGAGTVKEFLADGRVRVLFDSGEEHRYRPDSMHKISNPRQESLAMALATGDKMAVAKEVMAHHLNPDVIKVDNEGHVTASEELDEEISDLDKQIETLRKEMQEDKKLGVRAFMPFLVRKRTKAAPEATPGHARVDPKGKKLTKAKTSAKVAPEQKADEAAVSPAPAVDNNSVPRVGPAQVAPAPLPAIGTGQQRPPPKPPPAQPTYALPKPSIYGATEPPPAKLTPLQTGKTGLPADLPPLPGSGAAQPLPSLPSISAIGSAKRFAVKAPQHRPAPPRPPPAPPGALKALMAEAGAPPPPQRLPPAPPRPAAEAGWAPPPQGGASKPPPPPGRPPPGRPKVRY